MAYIYTIWEKTTKTLKFMWRHFFTLSILCIGFSAFIEGPLNWKNGFWMTAVAIFFDWAKQYFKFIPCPKRHNNSLNSSIMPFKDQWWDSSLRGTPSNFLSNMDNNRYR